MKRWIHASYTGEPSSVEYGQAVSQGLKRLQDRYEPFEVKRTYFNRSSTRSTGYRIFYPETRMEWIADDGGKDSWDNDYGYKLYGPFTKNEITSWSQLFSNASIGKFESLDQVMSYLFENYYDDSEDV